MNSEKKCTKCGIYKGISEFIKKCGMCRPCRSIHRKEYREKHKEAFKEKDRKHYEKYKAQKRAQQAEYYQKNKVTIQEQRKACRKSDPLHKIKQREYYHKNLNRRLSLVYRNRVRREIKSGKKYLEYLGCDIDSLKKWFEFNFELDGYTWDDYNILWEIDHVKPCATFDMTDESQVHECFNWKNTKPESKTFNKRKNSNINKNQIFEHELRLYIYKRQNLIRT